MVLDVATTAPLPKAVALVAPALILVWSPNRVLLDSVVMALPALSPITTFLVAVDKENPDKCPKMTLLDPEVADSIIRFPMITLPTAPLVPEESAPFPITILSLEFWLRYMVLLPMAMFPPPLFFCKAWYPIAVFPDPVSFSDSVANPIEVLLFPVVTLHWPWYPTAVFPKPLLLLTKAVLPTAVLASWFPAPLPIRNPLTKRSEENVLLPAIVWAVVKSTKLAEEAAAPSFPGAPAGPVSPCGPAGPIFPCGPAIPALPGKPIGP